MADEKKKNETSDFLKQIKDISSGLKSLSGISKKQSKNIKKSLGLIGKAIEEMPTGKDTNVSIDGMEDLGKGIASLSEVSTKGAKRSKKNLKILGDAFGDFAKKLDGKSVAKAINGFDEFGTGILKFSTIGWSGRKRIVKSLEDIGGAVKDFGGSPSMTKAFKATGVQFAGIVKNIEKLASLSKKRKGIVKTLKSIGGAFGVAVTGIPLKGSDSKLEAKEARKEKKRDDAKSEKRTDARFNMLTGAIKGISGGGGGGSGGGGLLGGLSGLLKGLPGMLGLAKGGIGALFGAATSPIGLAIGAALGGFFLGGKIFEKWLGPLMDKAFEEGTENWNDATRSVQEDASMTDAEGNKVDLYKIHGKTYKEEEATEMAKAAGYDSLEDAVKGDSKFSRKKNAKSSGGQLLGAEINNESDLAAQQEAEAGNKELQSMEGDSSVDKGTRDLAKRKGQLMTMARNVLRQERKLFNIINKEYASEDDAEAGEGGAQLEAKTAYEMYRGFIDTASRAGSPFSVKDVNTLYKQFPLSWSSSEPMKSFSGLYKEGGPENKQVLAHIRGRQGWFSSSGYEKTFGKPGSMFDGEAVMSGYDNLPGGELAMAKGGLVRGPIRSLIGEAGPELVLPLQQAPKFIADVLTKATNTLSNQQVGMQNILSNLTGNSSSGAGGAPVVVNTNTVMKNENNTYNSTNPAVRDVNGIQYKMRNSST